MQSDPFLEPEEAWMGAEKPAWEQSALDRSANAFKPNPRYGSMGRPIVRGPDVGGYGRPNLGSGNISIGSDIPAYAEGTKDSGPKPKLAIVGERGPEAMIVPAHSQIIPDLGPKAAQAFAIDEVDDSGPGDGEIRQDAQGNYWKYDAVQKRGIPMNPYIGNENAPSPDAFRSTAAERYLDLSNRLSALRQAGLAEGRAAVARLQEQQAQEAAKTAALLATGEPVSEGEGGGTLYRLPRGHAIIGGTRPKSFTVENWEGGQTASPDLAEVDRESRADAAERTVRGLPLRRYRALPTEAPSTIATAAPTAIEEVADVEVEAPVAVQPETRALGRPPRPSNGPIVRGFMQPPPDDRPEVAAAEARRKTFGDTKPEKKLIDPRGAPSDLEAQAKKLSRAESVAKDFADVLEGWAEKLQNIPKDVMDYLFNPMGTRAEREAEKLEKDAMIALEKKGFKVTPTSEGYRFSKKTEEEAGLVEPGNLDPLNRKVLQNPDGSSSTASTISIGTDKGEVLIPTVVNGVRLSEKDAISHYRKTGEHFGIFKTPKDANAFADKLHNKMADSVKR